MKQKKFKKRFVFRPARLFKHLVLILVAFISAFPFYWMLSAATNNTTDIIKGHILPGNYLMENWKALTAAGKIGPAFYNSMRNAGLLTIASMF